MNPLLPRLTVHAWSEEIGRDLDHHRVAVQRLLRDNRRLSKFVEENTKDMEETTALVCQWLVGVVARIFELAGGRMRAATWEQLRAASDRVGAAVGPLLPLDADFAVRARIGGRRQAHVLDEALYNLFEREPQDGEARLEAVEAAKVYLMMWVVTEVLDENWAPPKDTPDAGAYAFTPVG